MFEQRRVHILLFVLFATIVTVIVVFSSKSSSSSDTEQRSAKFQLERLSDNDDGGGEAVTTPPTPIEYIRVAMCSTNPNNTGHEESEKFCKCSSDGVVSCDFSEFKSDRVSLRIVQNLQLPC